MENPFASKQSNHFTWEVLGDVATGRGNLGQDMPVLVYRLFEFTMKDVLTQRYGEDACNEIVRAAGELAGSEFTKNVLDTSLDLDAFIAQLQKTMKDLRIGVLRVESFDADTGRAILTVSEDLDCSGLPMLGKAVCNYDEGFIAGILETYTKKPYVATEIDCWAKGDRVCRFEATVNE